MSLKPESPPNMTQGAYDDLRAELLTCRIMPGSRLKIHELCERFSVSLGAIREALSRLISEGLVVAEPQRGFRATPISAADLQDLTMTRIEVDQICLRRAIALGTVEWEAGLVAATHRLARIAERAAEDPARSNDEWAEAHAAFHLALIDGCNSPWLIHLHSLLYAQSERYRRLSVPFADGKRDVGQEHQEIVNAALARNAELAAKLLAEHSNATTRILLQAAADGGPVIPEMGKPVAPKRETTRTRAQHH